MTTKLCPKCNMKMVKKYDDAILCSLPPQVIWRWWCGCGNEELGGHEVLGGFHNNMIDTWKKINGKH